MTRYREAIDTIKRDYGFNNVSRKEFPTPEEVENAIKVLEELVDKGTPMKVIIQERVLDTDYYCPKCNGELLYGEEKYCDMCGQRLYLEESDNNAKD